ncbi:MAG: ABC transporter permease, partial [Betaproteobacteria bacterium]
MKKLIALAWRQWRRDSRTGELRVLAAALVLAVASVGTVALFADRVKSGLSAQANVLLGADLLISADRPLPNTFAAEAKKRGLTVVESIRFNSMVAAESSPVLADVKAVEPGYPLRGQIRLEDPAYPEGRPTRALPGPGEVWVDQRLRTRLGIKIGDKVQLGDAALTVRAVVQQEPEMSGGFLALSPKVLMTMADLAATNLLQPGNRASYRLLMAGAAADPFRSWVQPKLAAGQRVENIRDLRPEVKSTLERAEKFLGLSALVAVLLAAVAVALAARRYLQRQLDAAGIMRCLGASQGKVLML